LAVDISPAALCNAGKHVKTETGIGAMKWVSLLILPIVCVANEEGDGNGN
jgi:hypothetical protein